MDDLSFDGIHNRTSTKIALKEGFRVFRLKNNFNSIYFQLKTPYKSQ